MAGLEDLSSEIKEIYVSNSDDLEKIMNLLLSRSSRYNRIGSYFSSKSLVSLAEGLSEFILNDGKIRLIINYELNEEDYDILKKTINIKKIEEQILIDLENLKEEIVKNSAKVLGWLITEKKLEIRVVVGRYNNLMHVKQGIVEDKYGNKVAFSGSANETYKAYSGSGKNIEELIFFKDWLSGQEKYVETLRKHFEAFWNDKGLNTNTYGLKRAITNGLMRVRAKNFEDVKKAAKFISDRKGILPKEPIRPYPHQKEAMDNWFGNGNRGIIEMPTGCGKTKTGLFCYNRLTHEMPLVTLILTPTRTICNQWLHEFSIETEKICKIFDNSNWRNELRKDILDIKLGVRKELVIIGTYALLNSQFLQEKLRSVSQVKKFLIADEVHSTGAQKTSKGLNEIYNYRLGLSATPKRWLDDEGTEKINSYFGGTVYDKLGLFDAIYRLKVLSEYNYHIIHVLLNEKECSEYIELTKKYKKLFAMSKRAIHDQKLKDGIQRLLEKRADIIKNAEEKLSALESRMDKFKSDKCIIFVSPKQKDIVNSMLVKHNIKYHQFTFNESERIRKDILDDFKAGNINCIVAIKCLDEGLDVPAAKVGVMLSSSGNPREFIQRRGRLLRKDPTKDYAEIYDFFVTPPKEIILSEPDFQSQIIKELKRIAEFSKSAKNEMDVTKHLKSLMNKLNIDG